jgi:hypothetical protein
MESLYKGFGGFTVYPSTQKPHFPHLFNFLTKCGIVAPGILGQINKLRNEVEHEYHTPTLDELATFLDVTELFLAATDAIITRQPSTIEFEPNAIRDRSGNYYLREMSFDWKNAQLTLWLGPENASTQGPRVSNSIQG